METLFEEISKVLKEKNEIIETLKWQVEYLKKENDEMAKVIGELKNDIEKHKENEANRV